MLALLALAAAPLRAEPVAPVAQVWTSSADGIRKLTRQADVPLAPLGEADRGKAITIDPARRHQAIVGFGAAMTDASAHIFQTRMPRVQRDALFAELFGPQGLGLSFLRVPIGASDFSSEHYSLDDMPGGQTDPALKHFSMARTLAEQVPALRAVRAVNPRMVLMASPWSAPGWMKDSGSLVKGRLRQAAYPAFAAYFSRYLDGMARAGVPVQYLSVQNEPDFEPADYPGMRFDAGARARFVGEHLGPLLARRHRGVRLLDWDHNWDKPENPLAILADARARRYITGVAWHCYAGEPEAMRALTATYPDKEVFVTECSGGEWAPNWGETLGWMIDSLIIAPSRLGSRGTVLWNLALDEKYGPHLGGCGNCRGVVTVDSRNGTIARNVEYYALGHASRFVRQGARRIASDETGGLQNVAFVNPDGSRVLLAHNPGKAAVRLVLREGERGLALDLPAGEVVTLVWPGQEQ